MNIKTRAAELQEDFDFLTDWEETYAHIIDLGKALPPLEASERNETNKVRGCASQVWMVLTQKEGKLSLRAESDAAIVSGLIALLVELYDGAEVSDAAAFPINEFFESIGVAGTLTAQRSNGLASMVKRIQSITNSGE